MRKTLICLLVVFISCAARAAQNCSGIAVGIGASLNGFVPFPADNLWNQNISSAPVDPNSDAIINFIGANTPLHPDFGSGLYDGQSIGIPYVVVSGQALVKINYTAYGDESDPGPMPIPANAPIEGYPHPGNGDRHVLVLDRDNCWLYELYSSYKQKNGNWKAGSGAVWNLLADETRPYTPGPLPTPPACRSFPASRVTTKWPRAQSTMPCASPSKTVRLPSRLLPATGPRIRRTP